jgi:hypothetical protein
MRNMLAVLAFVALAPSTAVTAQTQTALKIGERATGQTKQCIYQALGNQYTRTVRVGEICPPRITVVVPSAQTDTTPSPPLVTPVQTTATAVKTGETATGEKRQCHYAALGQTFTREIGPAEVCPDSITVMVGAGCGRTGLEICARTDTSRSVTEPGSWRGRDNRRGEILESSRDVS